MNVKKTGSIKYPLNGQNPALGIVSEKFWQEIIVDQNRHRGKFYENIAMSIVIGSLSEDVDVSKLTILQDSQSFSCYNDGIKKRRYDIYIKELELAFEVKSARIILNKFTRQQMQKDKWLLENKCLKEVRWLLFEGASKKCLEALTQSKIIFIDASNQDSSFTNLLEVLENT